MAIPSWQPVVTRIDSGRAAIPSSAASWRAIRSLMMPLVLLYCPRSFQTARSETPEAAARDSTQSAARPRLPSTSKNRSDGRPGANETASG